MKKVALFMDGWKRYFTYAWPLGFMQKIKEARADVNLYIFNSNAIGTGTMVTAMENTIYIICRS